MGYIEDIRARVGHTPIILNSALIILRELDGRILLVNRNDTDNWGLPGGYMELGETFEDTAKRELKEELGIQVSNLFFLGIYSGPELYHEYPNGDKVYSVVALYQLTPSTEVRTIQKEEITSIAYFPITEMPKNMTKVSQIILNKFM